jgi:hypothetical protein
MKTSIIEIHSGRAARANSFRTETVLLHDAPENTSGSSEIFDVDDFESTTGVGGLWTAAR